MKPQQRHITQVDTETGEIYQALAVIRPKRHNAFKGWLAMAQDAMTQLANLPLGLQDWRVFAALCARLDFDNLINVNHADLGRQLNMERTHVGRSIRKLASLNIINEGPKINGHRTYRLQPDIAWKGSAKTHHEAMRQRMKTAGIRKIITNDTGTP